jgi:hypothetical protein
LSRCSTFFGCERQYITPSEKWHASRQQAHEKEQALSFEEEQLLLAWIQTEDRPGTSPAYARIRAMANMMCPHQTTHSRTLNIGKNWINKFKKRHPELERRKLCRIDIQRKDAVESL